MILNAPHLVKATSHRHTDVQAILRADQCTVEILRVLDKPSERGSVVIKLGLMSTSNIPARKLGSVWFPGDSIPFTKKIVEKLEHLNLK